MRIAFTHNLQRQATEREAEFDTPATVSWISGLLARAGHVVVPVDVAQPLRALIAALLEAEPTLIFNTAEGTRGRFREALYPALFEELGLPYTGSDAYTCALTLDKHLTKCRLAERGVPVAPGVFARKVTDLTGHRLRFPLIVKPNFEGSSKGIDGNSIVANDDELGGRVGALLARYPDGVLVEELIAGQDVVVPYIEGATAEGGVLEPASYTYRPIADADTPIYDFAMKNLGFDAIELHAPANISRDTRARVIELSKLVFDDLDIRDVGRIDFRVTPEGEPYFLEINALPSLEPGASLYLSGALAGLADPADVLDAVVQSAVARQAATRGPSRRTVAAHVWSSHHAQPRGS